MEQKKIDHKESIEEFKKHLDNTRSIMHYSQERIDILVISISTAALGFSITFIKDIFSNIASNCLSLLISSWFLFGIAIISNILSQLSSYYANYFESKITRNIIRGKQEKELKGNQKRFESSKSILNWTTIILNIISIATLLFGIVIFILFIKNNLNK